MTAKTQPQVKAADQPITVKSQNLWKEALGRLRRNRAAVAGGIIIILLVLTAIFAEQIAPYSYDEQSLANANAVPEWIVKVFPSMKPYAVINNAYPLGADALGRDPFSRIVYGTRCPLAVAFIGPIIALFIGVIYGSVSGFFSGGLDNIMMRVVDVLDAFPGLLFIILLMAFFRTTIAHPPEGSFSYYIGQLDAKFGGLLFIMIGIGLTSWETQARLRGTGPFHARAGIYRCSVHHWCEMTATLRSAILPNIIGPLIVVETLAIPAYIYTEAFLSFIGLGVNPPTPSWGSMIATGSRALRSYPNQALSRRWRWPSPCLPLTSSATGCAML